MLGIHLCVKHFFIEWNVFYCVENPNSIPIMLSHGLSKKACLVYSWRYATVRAPKVWCGWYSNKISIDAAAKPNRVKKPFFSLTYLARAFDPSCLLPELKLYTSKGSSIKWTRANLCKRIKNASSEKSAVKCSIFGNMIFWCRRLIWRCKWIPYVFPLFLFFK